MKDPFTATKKKILVIHDFYKNKSMLFRFRQCAVSIPDNSRRSQLLILVINLRVLVTIFGPSR